MDKKKAVVVGGGNGIGLAIAQNLVQQGYYVTIYDRVAPQINISDQKMVEYVPCDLLYFDDQAFVRAAQDEDVSCLVITAGIGRVADLEYFHYAEIKRTMDINATALMEIIRIFYDRIKNTKPFFCAVMGSIAGLVSSPMFTAYAASKAAVCRFTESLNIELEASGTQNRILNVSPGSIQGTSFNGGKTDLDQVSVLADEICHHMMSGTTLFIPQYDEIFKGVIERYQADPHEYGMYSYQYKKESGRVVQEQKVRIGYLSGTFDLFHIGHLNLLKRAKAQCDYLIVGVHPNAKHKNKETFISLEERKEIVAACKYVDRVVDSCTEDSDAWSLYHYNRLFVGSDYKGTERFLRYEEYFKDKGVEIVYFPYTQGTSSTQLRNAVAGE
jgi:glycerol-3-phosphate cytidylyltransferase